MSNTILVKNFGVCGMINQAIASIGAIQLDAEHGLIVMTPAELDTERQAARRDEREAIAQQVVSYSQCHADCDHRGVMDPETGDWPCTRKAGCWCDDIAEHGDELALEIRNRSKI